MLAPVDRAELVEVWAMNHQKLSAFVVCCEGKSRNATDLLMNCPQPLEIVRRRQIDWEKLALRLTLIITIVAMLGTWIFGGLSIKIIRKFGL